MTPTNSPAESEDDYYHQFEAVLSTVPHHYMKLVIGDFNAQIGPKKDDCKDVIGNEGFCTRSDNGDRLLNFCG